MRFLAQARFKARHPAATVLPWLVLAQFAGTSPWFAVNAVMPELQATQGWDTTAVGTLTSAVQAGFIAGTLLFALGGVADRFNPRRVFGWCALAAAGCSVAALAVLLWAPGAVQLPALLLLRAATGFFLAGIYPVGMKIAAQWAGPQGLGAALGWLVGALVLGSASPHALRGALALLPAGSGVGGLALVGGVMLGVALLCLAAAWAVAHRLPDPPATAAPPTARQAVATGPTGRSHLQALGSIWTLPRVRASAFGYFGHMFELYTLWVLVPLVLATRLQGAALSWAAFAVVGIGMLGCVAGGLLARRWGSARVAAVQLAASGLCCLAAPWALVAPGAVFAAWLLVWGMTVVGDSPQFSALTAANAPRHAMGSVLTFTNCIGFAISILSIEWFVRWTASTPLAQVLPWLALGPLVGLWALRLLWREPPQGSAPGAGAQPAEGTGPTRPAP
jgi:MFS family permease